MIHIGVACEFHVTVQRSGKRFTYLSFEIRQGGRLAITGVAVLASEGADNFVDKGGGVKGDIGLHSYTVAPEITREECGEQPGDLFGRHLESDRKVNAEEAMGRGRMWAHMHRVMPRSDVAEIRAWKKWRARKTQLDAEHASDSDVARLLGPAPSNGASLPTRGFVTLPGRNYDALSCALWVDNFPPFSLQAWRDPKVARGKGAGLIPGWTTVQLTTEWVRACESVNGWLLAFARRLMGRSNGWLDRRVSDSRLGNAACDTPRTMPSLHAVVLERAVVMRGEAARVVGGERRGCAVERQKRGRGKVEGQDIDLMILVDR